MSALPKRWQARLKLGFTVQNGQRSVLSHREHEGPILVQRALYPEGQRICHATILHPPSGIAGGDAIDIDIDVARDAHAALTTPGATRWYKSNGFEASQTVRLSVAAGARLDWLPLENILFEDADAVAQTLVRLESGAAAIGWEITQLGSVMRAGHWANGRLFARTGLEVDGELLWVDQGEIAAAAPLRSSVAGLAGFPVQASLWCFGPTMDAAQTEFLTTLMPWRHDLRAGATAITHRDGQSLYLVRGLGLHAETVRHLLIDAWKHLRACVLHTPGMPLRLWST